MTRNRDVDRSCRPRSGFSRSTSALFGSIGSRSSQLRAASEGCQKSFRRRAREFDELGPFWQLASHKNGEILWCAALRNRAEPSQVLPHLRRLQSFGYSTIER